MAKRYDPLLVGCLTIGLSGMRENYGPNAKKLLYKGPGVDSPKPNQARRQPPGPGVDHATKRLPTAKIMAICQQLKGQLIVLIGDRSDQERASQIIKVGQHIINACGQYNLHQSASIVSQARLVISHDTGFMHIAAALKRPIVSIWGNTIPAFGMYPYYGTDSTAQHKILQNQSLNCRPCSKIGHKYCPKGHFKCMQDIPNEKIVQQIEAMLSSN